MRFHHILIVAALLGLLIPLPLVLQAGEPNALAGRTDVMPIEAIKPGMKGYGLTVFSGTKPERFEVEVIGVLENFQPRQDLILIKTKHPRLEVAKVVAGMSGSPIFIDGKMIGAYAYGWSFGAEPVAGVTPIKNMLEDMARPLPKSIYGWPLTPRNDHANKPVAALDSGHRFAESPTKYDLLAHAAQIKSALAPKDAPSSLQRVATPLLVGGMSPGAVNMASKLLSPLGLEPLQAGGSSVIDPNAPTRFENGGAIGVSLVSGDVSAMGLGTVTRVEGDKLVAFGHPMMQSGVTALPTSLAKVLWVLASDQRSFKIGSAVRPLGALVNDRLASIVVDQKAQAPTIPVTFNIQGVPGAPYTKWQFQVAHERFMTPSFLAAALGSAFQATSAERQDVSWAARGKLKLKKYGNIELEDFGVSIGGTPDQMEIMSTNLVRSAGAVLNNPWEPAFLEGVDLTVNVRFGREILQLRGVECLTPEVEAGGTARLKLTMIPYAGPEVTRILDVPVPTHLAGETVNLTVSPGHQVDRDLPAPESLTDLIANLREPLYRPKSVVISYESLGDGVSYRRHVARDLPPGALDKLLPRSSSIGPNRYQAFVRRVIPMQDYMVGEDSVRIQVKPVLR